MPGTTIGWPAAALLTTNVWAAMSPTRLWPLPVRMRMKPTSGRHQGNRSTIRSSQRMNARPRPGARPSSRTVRMPQISLPIVKLVRPCSTTASRSEITKATGVKSVGASVVK
jgi:hypothetical protein